MNTYEIYDADPMQDPDSAWHKTIRAQSVDGASRQAKQRVKGYAEYPRGTTLHYITREADGSMGMSGTFTLNQRPQKANHEVSP